jgi:hypothetical protein
MMQYSRMRKHSSKIRKEEKLLLNDEYWTRKGIKATTYLLKSPVTLSSILESRYFLGKYYLLKKCYKLILRYGTLLGKTGFDESKDGQGCQRQYSRQSEEIARKCVQRTA